MPVYQKDNGKWYCRGRVNGERYHALCPGAETKEQAKATEDGIRYKLRQKQLGLLEEEQKITFGQIMDRYVDVCKANNKSDEDAKIYRKYLVQYFGKNKLARNIKPTDIDLFKLYMINKGKANATINRYISAIRRAYNIQIEDGAMNYSPIKKKCMLTEDNKRYRYLSKQEWKKLKMALSETIYYIVVVALLSGFRLSNVLELCWEQIDFNLRFIEILKQNNKGKKVIRMPISDMLFEVLMKLNPKEKGYVFIRPETGERYKDIRGSFKAALDRAGIKDFRFHDLRRTFGTWLLQSGTDIRTIQYLLSHSSVSVTERYLAVTPEGNKKAVDKISRFM